MNKIKIGTCLKGQEEQGGYSADIAIEGFHDPVYCGEREMEGQRNTLQYLKECREYR